MDTDSDTETEMGWCWDDYANLATDVSLDDLIEDHKTQLAIAVAHNFVKDLKLLLDVGGGINLTDCKNQTLIHYAVRCDKLEALELLLDTDGAPMDAEDLKFEETALLLALRESKEGVALKLIEKGADINLVDSEGNSALLNSVCNNLLQTSKLLIEKGADVNARNEDDETPLLIACRENWVESVCMLLCYGADVTIAAGNERNIPFMEASLEVKEILFDYIFNGDKIPMPLCTLTDAMVSDSPLLEKLFQNVSKVVYDDEDCYIIATTIPEMNPHYLKVFLQRFEGTMLDLLFHNHNIFELFSKYLKTRLYSPEAISRAIENLATLVNSPVSCGVVKVVEPFRSLRCQYCIIGDLIKAFDRVNSNQLQDLMNITSEIVAQGVHINNYDVSVVYLKYGYCPLFKQMIVRDINTSKYGMRGRMKHLMPELIYDIKMTIEKFLSKTDGYDLYTLDRVLEYFCHQGLKEFCSQLSDKMKRKVKELPNVPLLVEIARNVTRTYIIDVYTIENFRQFKNTLETFPIPEKHKKILTYEDSLYL